MIPMLTTAALAGICGAQEARVPSALAWVPNLLVDAEVSASLEGYAKGLRGEADHMIYDTSARAFLKPSQHHEYGVGFGEDLGVVSEEDPAWWMAEWAEPVEVNTVVLSGVYPNQPQPETAWKVEVRREGEWETLESGVGGWYNTGRWLWGGPEQETLRIDGLRVSVFSKDDQTPLRSIHFRGEEGVSWIVALVPPVDVRMRLPAGRVKAGEKARFSAELLAGRVDGWGWDFGDGGTAAEPEVEHAYREPGTYQVSLSFTAGEYEGALTGAVRVAVPFDANIEPLTGPVMVGEAVQLQGGVSVGKAKRLAWDFGDGKTASGKKPKHTFGKPGIYKVTLTATDDKYTDECMAIIRAHTDETLQIPQVHLDTDQNNEQDDQHYLGYGVFSELDILGVNSIHHGGGQEQVNYDEIIHVLDLARQSGLPEQRQPFVFRGADERLPVPESKDWRDTAYEVTEASEAILASVRGASPEHPVWVVPVGPGTNTATAILQARDEGLDLHGRLRVMWLGGSNDAVTGEFNGNNDPWSMYVVGQSGIETWIMPAPVGARVAIDKRTEADWYADHALGRYLLGIVPARNKPLFDPSCLSAIISQRLDLDWVREWDDVTVGGPDAGYRWLPSEAETTVKVIREIDQLAMKQDIFDSMKGRPRRLRSRTLGL